MQQISYIKHQRDRKGNSEILKKFFSCFLNLKLKAKTNDMNQIFFCSQHLDSCPDNQFFYSAGVKRTKLSREVPTSQFFSIAENKNRRQLIISASMIGKIVELILNHQSKQSKEFRKLQLL